MELTFINLFLLLIIQRLSLIFNLRIINFSYSSYITLKVKGSGNIKIYDNYKVSPDEIYINGIKEEDIKNVYNLNKEDRIKLVWNNNIQSCFHMFYECPDITEIDLSNFDSSEVTNMRSMFKNCNSLTSINFNNFNTSKVTEMTKMFLGCSSLTSIDVSSFKTYNVKSMSNMFQNCITLTSLNFSRV